MSLMCVLHIARVFAVNCLCVLHVARVCAAYRSCNVVYVCDDMEIRGMGRAILELISAITF